MAGAFLPGVLGLVLALFALGLRPPAPLDELRYLGVAWEMWLRGDFLVPHLNGTAYAHKPPLLFWLMQAGWALIGVNDWWPRLVPALAGVCAVAMLHRLARDLWPARSGVERLAPWFLGGCLAWLFCLQMVMFDVLLCAWVILGMGATWRAALHGRRRDVLLLGLAIGGGLLTKGPVVLIHLLLPAALAPLWHAPLRPRAWWWAGQLLLALALGAAIALAWVVPAALRGGPEYAGAILWHQTADRVENSFAHARAWWYYLLVLPTLLLPWIVMPSAWRSLATIERDTALRFLSTWAGAVLLGLSLVSGKQPHYLLPVLPALALVGARLAGEAGARVRLSDRLVLAAAPLLLAGAGAAYLLVAAAKAGVSWTRSGAAWPLLVLPACLWVAMRAELCVVVPRAAAAMALVIVLLLAGIVGSPLVAGHDLHAPALMAGQVQRSGAELVAMGHYQGQLTFLGRLDHPVAVVAARALPAWSQAHPGAYVLVFKDALPEGVAAELVASYPYREHHLRLWRLAPTATAGALR